MLPSSMFFGTLTFFAITAFPAEAILIMVIKKIKECTAARSDYAAAVFSTAIICGFMLLFADMIGHPIIPLFSY